MNALLKQPSIPRVRPPSAKPEAGTSSSSSSERTAIDRSVLDASQHGIVELVDGQPSREERDTSTDGADVARVAASEVASRVSQMRRRLMPTIDGFAAGMHDIELYRSAADMVSSRVLGICSQRLEERDGRGNAQRRLTIRGGREEAGQEDWRAPREDLGIILGALSRVER